MNTAQLFTTQEANKTLPLVKGIVNDILTTGQQIRDLAGKLGDSFHSSSEVQHLLSELREHLSELDAIGCLYKDTGFSTGLVDFPAIIEGKEVVLCWRSDETEIRYYHDVNAGYAGRRLIPERYLSV